MGATENQRWVRVPTGGDVYAAKGEPMEAAIRGQLMARNLNYVRAVKTSMVLMCGHGHESDAGSGPGASTNYMFWDDTGNETLGPYGRAPVWHPHSKDLTLAYMIRARPTTSGNGEIKIYCSSGPWGSSTAPSSVLTVSTAITISSDTTYSGTLASCPVAKDGMVYLYMTMKSAAFRFWCVYPSVTP